MKHFFNPSTHAGSLVQLLKWSCLIVPPAVLVGSASAFFLWSLDAVTRWRWEHGWLLFLLPLGGLSVGLLYLKWGKSTEGGNNLIVDQIHQPGGGVPARMAPLILVSTLITHLFGGSAGREGTAVQIGGSIASAFGRLFRLGPTNLRVLLLSGVAAGFGSVFGTPLTGAVFAMEVLTVGRMQYEALIPVLVASVVGDLTCSAWGIKHALYHIAFSNPGEGSLLHLNLWLLGKVVLVGSVFGLASLFFSELAHALQMWFKKSIAIAPLRPVIGGLLVIGGVFLLGSRDYLGIGVSAPAAGDVTILSAFQPGGAHTWSWLWKVLFTVVTLGSGFKGGEVTPLFFIGATLGNTLAGLLNAPADLLAGLGFIAVFAGSTNTPLACTIMGIELFGAPNTVYFATACFMAYFFSGHSGIYLSQRIGVPKRDLADIPAEIDLREARELSRRLTSTQARDRTPLDNTLAPDPNSHLNPTMPNPTHIAVTEMGKLRIYLAPSEKLKATGLWSKLQPKPVYQEIIQAARRNGIVNAIIFNGHHGFTNHDRGQPASPPPGDSHLPMCIELVDHKHKLEDFCRQHGELLNGKTVVYKPVEHWSINAAPVSDTAAGTKV